MLDNLPTSFADLAALKGIMVGHLNICHLLNKVDHLRTVLSESAIDLLGISESWLDESVADLEINIPGYYNIRQDRNGELCKSKGGGICVYIKEAYKCIKFDELCFCDRDLECLGIRLELPKTRKIFILNVYRPPAGNKALFQDKLHSLLDCTLLFPGCEVMILGDFNLDSTDRLSIDSRYLRGIANTYGLVRAELGPTRITETSVSSIDHIFTNREDVFASFGQILHGLSDHNLIYLQRKKLKLKVKTQFIRARTFRKYDSNKFCTELSTVDWNPVLSLEDPNEAWDAFLKLFVPICDKYAPYKRIKIKGNIPPWLTTDYFSASDLRDHLFRVFKRTQSPEDHTAAKRARNLANNLNRNLKREYITTKIWKIHQTLRPYGKS